MTSARDELRMRAVEALLAADPDSHLDELLEDAETIYTWVTRPSPVVRLVGHVALPFPTPEGPPIMANPKIPVGFSDIITIEPEDTVGAAVADTLTWSSSNPTAASVTVDATTLIGTFNVLAAATDVTVTATDGTNSFSYTFDAVVDAPVTLVGTVGVPFRTPAV